MISWKVALRGQKDDLKRWEHCLPKPHLPYVEWFESDGFDSNYLLTQHNADSFTSVSNALAAADQVIATLNGVMRVSHACQPIRSTGIVMRFQDDVCVGQAAIMRGQTGQVYIRGGIATLNERTVGESAEQRLFSQTLGNQSATDILKRLGNCADWGELWLAYESIEKSRPKGKKQLRQELSLNEKELNRFTQTCNTHRHHHFQHTPATPMSFEEATSYLLKLARGWMAQL